MGWCESLSAVDSYQCVLLYGDVELEEPWLVHAELRTPKDPWGNTLTHSLPYIHLTSINGVVLLMEHSGPS